MKKGDAIEFKPTKGLGSYVRGSVLEVLDGGRRIRVQAWGRGSDVVDVPARRVRVTIGERTAPRSSRSKKRTVPRRPSKFGPIRSENYLEHVRVRPCCVCGAPGPSEPHHFGPRGVGQKCSDLRTVPLCSALNGCHDQFHQSACFLRVGYDTPALARLYLVETQVSLLEEFMALTTIEAAWPPPGVRQNTPPPPARVWTRISNPTSRKNAD